MKKRDIVIIGAGRRIAEGYVSTLLDLQKENAISISRIVDINKNSAEELACTLSAGSGKGIEALQDVCCLEGLKDSLVIIVTPITTHKNIIAELVKKDKPWRILVEKPLSDNIADIKEIIKLQQEHHLDIRVAYQFRFSLAFRHFLGLKNIIETEKIENLSYMPPILLEFNKMRAISNRPSIGVLHDCVTHFIDLVNFSSRGHKVKLVGVPIIFTSMFVDQKIQKKSGLQKFIPFATDVNLLAGNGTYFQIRSNVYKTPRERYLQISMYDTATNSPMCSLKFNLEEETLLVGQSSATDKDKFSLFSYRKTKKFPEGERLQSFFDSMPHDSSRIQNRLVRDSLTDEPSFLCTAEEDFANIKLVNEIESKAIKIKISSVENLRLHRSAGIFKIKRLKGLTVKKYRILINKIPTGFLKEYKSLDMYVPLDEPTLKSFVKDNCKSVNLKDVSYARVQKISTVDDYSEYYLLLRYKARLCMRGIRFALSDKEFRTLSAHSNRTVHKKVYHQTLRCRHQEISIKLVVYKRKGKDLFVLNVLLPDALKEVDVEEELFSKMDIKEFEDITLDDGYSNKNIGKSGVPE